MLLSLNNIPKVVKYSSIFLLMSPVCMSSIPAYANSETATANASIFEQIEFAVLLEMDFGKIATRSAGGIVNLSPSTNARDCGTGLTCLGSFTFSRMSLTGTDALVRVTYPHELELTGPGDPMRVEPTLTGGSGALIQLTDGSAEFNFGARLFVNPNQESGNYSGTFSVNVNYE